LVLAGFLLTSCATRSVNHPYGVGSEPSGGMQTSLFDPLASLYTDTSVSSGTSRFVTDIPKDGAGSVVVMVSVPEASDSFELTLEGPEADRIEFYRLSSVPVNQNTGYFGMTESHIGFDNRHIVRHAPFSIFEILEPSEPGRFAGETVYAFYLKLRIGADAEPGVIGTSIVIHSGDSDAAERLSWNLTVHDVLPASGPDSELLNTNWFNGPHNGFEEKFDEDYWRLFEEQTAFRREGGQNVTWVPDAVMFDTVQGVRTVNKERLGRFIEIADRNGMYLFEGYMMAKRAKSFRSRDVVVGSARLPAGSPEAAQYISDTYGALYEYLTERNLQDRWVQHILDEPQTKQAAGYRWIAAELRKVMPGIRIIEATKTRKPLVGSVDIWNPLINDFQRNEDFFQERRDDGDEVWIYTAMVPGGPWLNRFIDQERLRSVYIGWGASKFDVGGYLRWGFDQWRRNQDIREGDLSTTWSGRLQLPQGDEFVVFPGPDGQLLSTTRWEAGRLGLEDYRLLTMLKAKDESTYNEVVSMCFTDFKTYQTDPQAYRKARRTLLESLTP
jgi:hypothetical protein